MKQDISAMQRCNKPVKHHHAGSPSLQNRHDQFESSDLWNNVTFLFTQHPRLSPVPGHPAPGGVLRCVMLVLSHKVLWQFVARRLSLSDQATSYGAVSLPAKRSMLPVRLYALV
jgi:hypothetical protein